MHASFRIALRHFLMKNSASGGHPLHVAGAQGSAIPQAVAVVHRSPQDIGDGFDAAMGVPGKTGPIIVGAIVTEIVQQKKWIELAGLAKAEGPPQLYSGPFQGRLRIR